MKNGLLVDRIARFIHHLGCKLFHPLCVYGRDGPIIPTKAQSQRNYLHIW